jgi:hypothetical protein
VDEIAAVLLQIATLPVSARTQMHGDAHAACPKRFCSRMYVGFTQ